MRHTTRSAGSDVAAMREMVPEDIGDVCAGLREVASKPHLRKIFSLGFGIMILQQLSGINTMMYYGASILIMCGFKTSQSVGLTAALALAQGVGIAISMPLFDRVGRRKLIIPSTLGAAA